MRDIRIVMALVLALLPGVAGCGHRSAPGDAEGAIFREALAQIARPGEVCFLAYPGPGGRGWIDPPAEVFAVAARAGRSLRPGSEAVLPGRDNPQLMSVVEKGGIQTGCFLWLDVRDRNPRHLSARLGWLRTALSRGAYDVEANFRGGAWRVTLTPREESGS